jgi:glycosyltransferase involved in cell wall biosynthesis
MELPCILTNINGCNEIIEHHKNGLIVEPKNNNELYSTMNKMLEEGLSTQLSLNNRNDIIKKYDRKVFHQYLLEEYNKVLKND